MNELHRVRRAAPALDKDALQREVAAFWNAEPCDSENSRASSESRQYYLDIEADRYTHQDHILEVLEWLDWSGKRVLEIGAGVGTDARQLISRGAIYHGVNVDARSCELARNALDAFGLDGEVRELNATDLQFESGMFDAVYTFGVLHHIPEVEKAIFQIHRVLKPGGHLLFMVYNKSSINYQLEIRYLRRWMLRMLTIPGAIGLLGKLGFPEDKLARHAQLFRSLGAMSLAEWLSRNTDGPDNPFSAVYGRGDVDRLLGDRFEVVKEQIYFFDWRHWGPLGRLLPRSVVRWLGRHSGWHRVVLARRK